MNAYRRNGTDRRTRGGLTVLDVLIMLIVLVALAAFLLPIFARQRG